jgi:uncharacterized membrane protein
MVQEDRSVAEVVDGIRRGAIAYAVETGKPYLETLDEAVAGVIQPVNDRPSR